MTRPSYSPDRRPAAAIVAALSDTAVGMPLPASLRGEGSSPPQTWADLLFDGDELADDTEPSQALLRAVAGLHAGLVEHEDRLPDLARGWLMSERLGVPRLPIVPDRVVVVVDGDPKRMPVVLPPDSLLKAGKGRLGERLYATTEPLTVLGAPILGAHSHRILDSGADVAAWRRTDLSNGKGPVFAPFGEASDPAAGHELYVASDLLRFTKGTLVITLTFDNVTVNGVSPASMTAVANVLKALRWEISTAEGMRAVSAAGGPSTTGIELTFSVTGGSAPRPLAGTPRYFLRGRFPASATGFSRTTALGFGFRTLRLKVDGYDVPPDAGYAGDGLLDITKEFEPFGPVPRRGDSFFLRLDEAFGKPLTFVKVTLSRLGSGETFQPAEYGKKQSTKWLKMANEALKGKGVTYKVEEKDLDSPDFTVRWERYDGAAWQWFEKQTTDFASADASFSEPVPRPFSTATSIGGSPGNYVRAFLYHGDFGWDDFQATMARNAYEIATNHPGNVKLAIPPDPPVLSQVRIRYTTEQVSSASGRLGVYARNALSSVASLLPAGVGAAIHPFRQDEDGFDGVLYLGVGEPLPLGEVVSVYARVDEADACAAVQGDPAVLWQYRAGSGAWRDLPCVDGTLGLRQSGILRFVAPLDWALGAPEADESAGRWVRARTHAPEAAGHIRLLRTDAVEAAYRLAPGHALDDATPATPISAGAITALRAPVLGIKKVANPAPSAGGRGPEPDAAFFDRSGGVLRHRNRAITPWDVEQLARSEFSELALVGCLPHHARSGSEAECAAGWLAVVPVPRSSDRAPVPSVRIAAAIETFLLERGPTDLSVAVLCPLYAEVGVRATLHLVPGVAAASAREAVEAALRSFLHPLSTLRAGGFGEPLYSSAVVRFLEEQAVVDHVSDVEFLAPYAGLERVDVDACRGLIASAAAHELFAEAVL